MDLNLKKVSGILSTGGTILGTTNHGDPFGFPVRNADGSVQAQDLSARLKRHFAAAGLEGLICIGGDGTLSIAERLSREHQIPVVGVPKTIDNDVAETDWTFGHQTAVQTATNCIDMLHSTAEAHDRIMVVEVMGRDAGHIAVAAGLGRGGPPNSSRSSNGSPWFKNQTTATIRASLFNWWWWKVRKLKTEPLSFRKCHRPASGAHGQIRRCGAMGGGKAGLGHGHGDPGDRFGTAAGARHRIDRMLATAFGAKAADLAAAGDWGRMVALKTPEVVTSHFWKVYVPRAVEYASA